MISFNGMARNCPWDEACANNEFKYLEILELIFIMHMNQEDRTRRI